MLIDLVEARVDGLFTEKRQRHAGQWCEIPILGGHYVAGEDNDKPLRKKACRGLHAREWFGYNGPADAQPLSISVYEHDDLKKGPGLYRFLRGLFGQSLHCLDFDVALHPNFDEYIAGVLAAEEQGQLITFQLFDSGEVQRLKLRFRPRIFPGLGAGCCWKPPGAD